MHRQHDNVDDPPPVRPARPPALAGLPLHHVAIAVASIDVAAPAFETVAGAAASPRERVDAQGVEVCFIGTGPGKLELLEPLGPDTPVGRFLARRGPGLHHIAYRVTDLSRSLRELDAAGFELIDREPRPGAHGQRVAFLHPRTAGGVLIELVEE